MAPCRHPSIPIHVCRAVARAHWDWEFLAQAQPCRTHRPVPWLGVPPTPAVMHFGEMKNLLIHWSAEIQGAHLSIFLILATSPRENRPSLFQPCSQQQKKGASLHGPLLVGWVPRGSPARGRLPADEHAVCIVLGDQAVL